MEKWRWNNEWVLMQLILFVGCSFSSHSALLSKSYRGQCRVVEWSGVEWSAEQCEAGITASFELRFPWPLIGRMDCCLFSVRFVILIDGDS